MICTPFSDCPEKGVHIRTLRGKIKEAGDVNRSFLELRNALK